MRQTFAILMLFTYLMATTELHQVLRIPILLEHYTEHRKENKNIGFVSYLKMHYSTVQDNDDDASRDAQLPFKAAHIDEIVIANALPPAPPSEYVNIVEYVPLATSHYQSPFRTSDFQFSIWQPPRA